MLTVKEAAVKLQVTPERVRNMIYDGTLPAEKFGSNWSISEQVVLNRIASKPKRGRPKKNAMREEIQYYIVPIEHHLFEECSEVFSNGYDADIVLAAQDEAEKAFYVMMWDFFLQQKQKSLVAQGVY